jgi:hypothetical protein
MRVWTPAAHPGGNSRTYDKRDLTVALEVSVVRHAGLSEI